MPLSFTFRVMRLSVLVMDTSMEGKGSFSVAWMAFLTRLVMIRPNWSLSKTAIICG